MADLTGAEVEELVHGLAVDGVREAGAEVDVLHQLAHDRVGVALVHVEREPTGGVGPAQYLVAVGLSALCQQGEVGEADVAVLEVDVAGAGPQGDGFSVLDQIGDDAVDVGELVAFGVDLPVVGVAHSDHLIGREGHLDLPRSHHGPVRIQVDAVLLDKELCPVVDPRLVDEGLQFVFGNEVGMELAQVVFGRERRVTVVGQALLQKRVGGTEAKLDRGVVDLDDLGLDTCYPLPVDPYSGTDHVGAQQHRLVEKDQVVGGEGVAVRPLEAFTEFQGMDRAVGVGADRCGQRGDRHGPAEVPLEQGFGGDGAPTVPIARSSQGASQGATVLADLLERLDHHRVGRQALVYRR